MANDSGKVSCPVCGATSRQNGFGNDGVKRVSSTATQPKSDDAKISARRARAAKNRRKNG